MFLVQRNNDQALKRSVYPRTANRKTTGWYYQKNRKHGTRWSQKHEDHDWGFAVIFEKQMMVWIYQSQTWVYSQTSHSWESSPCPKWDFFLIGADQGATSWTWKWSNQTASFISLIALFIKYYNQELEAVLNMTACQFFGLLEEIQYLEDPKKIRKTKNLPRDKIKKLESKRDFEDFFFG